MILDKSLICTLRDD